MLFLLQGNSAVNLLQYLCSNDINVPPGSAVRTLILNSKGGIESFCTAYRLAHDRYILEYLSCLHIYILFNLFQS